MQLLFKQKIKTLLKKVCKYGCLWPHNFDNNANFEKALGHIMYMVVLLLFRLILLSKTICRLSFRGFSVVITWLVKYGRDFTGPSIEKIYANNLAVGALTFKI